MKKKLPSLIQTLLDQKIYPHPVEKVDLIQTQMSFILLAGNYVYKIKKPVNFGFLDYSTLEKRRTLCYREVELNRRLAPQVYLGVVPITQGGDKFFLDGPGEIVEYAVKMKKLPQEKMMDVLLDKGQVTEEMIKKVAKILAKFHKTAETNPEISRYGKLEVIRTNTEENFTQTEKYIGISISRAIFQQIKDYTRNFIKKNKALFKKRVREGKIKDCHGDVHAAHICFEEDISIYDCIEFNERFRYGDVVSEIAFLAMDLDFHGAPHLSKVLVSAYVEDSKDQDFLKLLNFYKCYRAYVRGKVESFKLDDPFLSEKEKKATLEQAQKYFKLAHSYTKPFLVMMVGLTGTGKSTIARALARKTGWEVISSDVIRKRLAGIPLDEHRFEQFGKGIYSKSFSKKVTKEMTKRAKKFLAWGFSIIVDATFRKKKDRQKARKLAKKMKAKFLAVECVLDEGIVKERLEQRFREKSVSDGRWEIYERQKEDFDPVNEIPPKHHLVIDTSRPTEETVGEILRKIEKLRSES